MNEREGLITVRLGLTRSARNHVLKITLVGANPTTTEAQGAASSLEYSSAAWQGAIRLETEERRPSARRREEKRVLTCSSDTDNGNDGWSIVNMKDGSLAGWYGLLRSMPRPLKLKLGIEKLSSGWRLRIEGLGPLCRAIRGFVSRLRIQRLEAISIYAI